MNSCRYLAIVFAGLMVSYALFGADWPTSRRDAGSTGFAEGSFPLEPQVLWEFSPPKSGFEGTPILVGGRAYLGDVEGNIYALNLENGDVVWQVKFKNGFVVPAAYHDDRIVIGDFDGHMVCLHAADGSVAWETELNQAVAAGANFFGDNVLVTSEGGQLFSFDLKTGKQNWEFSTGDQLRSAPTIWKECALLGGCDSRLHRIDISKGQAAAEGLPLEGPTGSTPAVTRDIAIVPTQSGQVLAFNLETGERLWLFEDRERSQEIRSSPALGAVGGDQPKELAVVTTRNRRVLALNIATGEMAWEAIVRKRCDSSAVISDGRVWVGATDGQFYAFDLATGKQVWSYQLTGQLLASPAISDNKIVVATDKGNVVCFGTKSSK